jgi:MFS family permease
VFGAAIMASSLGMAFGPLAGGWVFDTFGNDAWLYVGSFGIGLGAAAVALALLPLPSRPVPRLQPAGAERLRPRGLSARRAPCATAEVRAVA